MQDLQCMQMPTTTKGSCARLVPAIQHVQAQLMLAQVHRTEDNRVMTVQLPKAKACQHWHRLFRGDPDGARCLQPPYQLSGTMNRPCCSLTL